VSISVKARTGTTRSWKLMRRVAIRIYEFHIPVTPLLRPVVRVLYGAHVAVRETLIWVLRVIWCEPLFRSQCHYVGSHFQMEKLPYITGVGRMIIGEHVRLSGKSSFGFGNRNYPNPELVIGNHTFIGHNCAFLVARSITVGNHCLLAGGVRLSDYDGHPTDYRERRVSAPVSSESIRPIVIGDDVWIGTGAYILKGVHIGDRTIIGAGSVVTRDIPSDVIAAGNPARVVKVV
jgi:acetyltransferase-like isoleucine patch superfamily enzyme